MEMNRRATIRRKTNQMLSPREKRRSYFCLARLRKAEVQKWLEEVEDECRAHRQNRQDTVAA
jgi:hypothetical protein